MSSDWVKMRASLGSNPKVLRIASLIGQSQEAARALTTGYNGGLHDVVTRDVTRDVTLASLLRVWCAVNDHSDDGILHGITVEDLDQIAGVPGFGVAMESVGWVVYDEDAQSLTFPNFLEHNVPAKSGRRGSAAERQKRYRERMKSDVTRDVTRDVTNGVTRDVTRDAHKSKSKSIQETPLPPCLDTADFRAAWRSWAQHRIEKKQRLTPTAMGKQLKRLEAMGHDRAVAAIEHSISNGYTGIF